MGYTEVTFRGNEGEFKGNQYIRYGLTDYQHEEFVKELSKAIYAIAIKGE